MRAWKHCTYIYKHILCVCVCVLCVCGKNIFPSERVAIQYLHTEKFIISSHSSEYGGKSGNDDVNIPNLGIADTDFYIFTSSQCI